MRGFYRVAFLVCATVFSGGLNSALAAAPPAPSPPCAEAIKASGGSTNDTAALTCLSNRIAELQARIDQLAAAPKIGVVPAIADIVNVGNATDRDNGTH